MNTTPRLAALAALVSGDWRNEFSCD